MQSVARFRVVSPFLSVRPATGQGRFFTLPVGAIVETLADLDGAGLIEITCDGNHLLAFRRDIRERAEQVHERPWPLGA